MQSGSSESTSFYEFLAWLEVNKKRVIIGIATVCALFVVVYVYLYFREQTELAASRALMALRPAAGASEAARDLSPTDLLKVTEAYPSTSAGERALLLAAGSLFGEGKYAEAQTQFERFQRDQSGSLLNPIAALGVASCLDALDKVDAAMAAYQTVANQYPDDPAAMRARLGMAALHEVKRQPEQALKIYEELSKQAGAGTAVMEALHLKERLLRQFPQLALTNTPTTAPTTPIKATANAVPATNPAGNTPNPVNGK